MQSKRSIGLLNQMKLNKMRTRLQQSSSLSLSLSIYLHLPFFLCARFAHQYQIHTYINDTIDTYMDTLRKQVRKNSLQIAMEINRLSLNSDGAFRTMIHKRTPQAKNNTSTVNTLKIGEINSITERVTNKKWCVYTSIENKSKIHRSILRYA